MAKRVTDRLLVAAMAVVTVFVLGSIVLAAHTSSGRAAYVPAFWLVVDVVLATVWFSRRSRGGA